MLTGEQERILRRVLRLVDISGDLDRNKLDGDFVDAGGTILSVVDENIFEMFVRPSRHRQSVETFYADIWSEDGKAGDQWESFESQAALITAEFILSGPGGDGYREIVLTDQHRWELASRIETLIADLREQVARRQKDLKRDDLKKKFAIVADLGTGTLDKASSLLEPTNRSLLEADVRNILAATDALKERIMLARVSAEFFTNDPINSPLDQLRRISSNEMRSKFGSFQARFNPTTREIASIEADADEWYKLLAAELKRPGHRHRTRAQFDYGEKNPGKAREFLAKSLLNDARSIAWVQWAARRLIASERFVLITGDPVVFDAYRRWHIEEDLAGHARQPFVLRRATQYIPVFNPHDTGGDLSVAEDNRDRKAILFTLIQQAVEAALVHVSVSLKPSFSRLSEQTPNLGREQLALKLIDAESLGDDPELGPLAQHFNASWIKQRANEFKNIRDSWQRAQRNSIGASIKLIARRVSEESKQKAGEYYNETGSKAAAILNEYHTEVLEKLVGDSIHLWVPLAETYKQPDHDRFHRTSGAKKRFEAALGNDLQEKTPKAVFARAACLGLEMQDIANANRFATLALRADRVDSLRSGAQASDADLLYLQAVTLRYLINSVDLHFRRGDNETDRLLLISRGVDQVKRHYGQASGLIERCVALHADQMQGEENEEKKRTAHIRLLRALSERASLNLFMSTSLGLAARKNSSPLLSEWDWYLDIARGDLNRCVKLDEYEEESADPVLRLVRDQYIPNLAAYEVLAFILYPDNRPFHLQHWPRPIKRQIKDFWRRSPNIHPLLEAEYIGYFVLTEDKESIRDIRQKKRQDREQIRLPLDRILYDALVEELPAT